MPNWDQSAWEDAAEQRERSGEAAMTVEDILEAFERIEDDFRDGGVVACKHGKRLAASFAFDLSRLIAQDAGRELVLRRKGR